MLRAPIVLAPALLAAALAAAPVLAQSAPQTRLPDPSVSDEAPPSTFVAAARSAIAAGRIGEAREAVERAEARVLIRSVRPSLAGVPSDDALVRALADARHALERGDLAVAITLLENVAAHPALDAPVR